MIRFARPEDTKMKLSKYSRREMEVWMTVDCSEKEYLSAWMKYSDTSFAWAERGKVKALFGFTKNGDFWLMFSPIRKIHTSFIKDLLQIRDLALARYGVIRTVILADKDTMPDFKIKLAKIMGGVFKPYTSNGHEFIKWEMWK